MHGQGQAKRQVFSWSRQFCFGACQNVLATVSKFDWGTDCPDSSLINLEEPWLQHCPRSLQAGVTCGSQLHGFKPGVAVKNPRRVKLWFVTFGVEVQVPAPYVQWLCMVPVRQRGRSVVGQGNCGLGHAKSLGHSVQVGLGNFWPVISVINLAEPWLQHWLSSVQAGVKFGSQLHGFKPGVAVNNQESKHLV